LGLDDPVLAKLAEADIEVRQVPEFCPHWRRHFTWKIWCIADAPCRDYLWLDAGICVLRPLDEAFIAIDRLGYFAPTNGWSLKTGICEPLRQSLGLDFKSLDEILSITGGVHGLNKSGKGSALIAEALRLAMVEENMRATEPLHRHDQALLSALLHRYFAPLVIADHLVYAGWHSASQFAGQKIWVHRRSMRTEDLDYYINHLLTGGMPHLPLAPSPRQRTLVARLRETLSRRVKRSGSRIEIYDGIRE
jgi:hypothetical protein